MDKENTKAARERIEYEYMLYPTPRYTESIDESYEVHKVIPGYTENGYPQYIIVFRRNWKETLEAKKRNFPDIETE